MRRNMWKIIENVQIDSHYDMTQNELLAIIGKAGETNNVYSAFVNAFRFGYALGKRQEAAANKKGRSC